jgi:uncharacterized damage-inducible protein DinB
MKTSEALLPEFDQEMANTRKVLERVPEDKLGWKPHVKSFTMGRLATHVATLPSWVNMTMAHDKLDVSQPFKAPQPTTNKELLDIFDKAAMEARAIIASSEDNTFLQPWSLMNGSIELFTMPKIAVLRSFVMNHLIHHRAQLCVYLRLNDLPLPGLYGPTADESPM